MARLKVTNLSKRYGAMMAVRDLSFSLEAGETLGFLGRNGAGKSTTIKMLCGLTHPTTGEATLEGESLLGPKAASIRGKLGVVVETPRFYPQLSGRRNLEFVARLHGASHERVSEMLDLVGLGSDAGSDGGNEANNATQNPSQKRFGHYSSGMKQRLGLAAVFLHQPDLVILDEPTSGLDPVVRLQILELVRTLSKNEGAAVLLCSHLMDEVQMLCDRVLVIEKGELALEQILKSKKDMQAVEDCFAALAGTVPRTPSSKPSKAPSP